MSQSFRPRAQQIPEPPSQQPGDEPLRQEAAPLTPESVGPTGAPSLDQALPDYLIRHIMSFLPHRDVVSASRTSRSMHDWAQGTRLEGTGTTLGMLNQVMGSHELLGYHGARKSEADSLCGGLDANRAGENWNGTGQLGPGFYLFPADWANAKQQASKYGDDSAAYAVFGRGLAEPYDRKASGGDTWPGRHMFDEPMEEWDADQAKRYPYLHPSKDAVRDNMDQGGLPELKINPHVYDDDARTEAREALRRFPWNFDYTPDDWEAEEDGTWDQMQFDERMEQASVQIAPPPREDGTLGAAFLEAVGRRWHRDQPPEPEKKED